MITRSQAGEFEISIERFEIEGDKLVLVGAMGVWEARTYLEPHEVARLIGKIILSPRVLGYILRLPFLLVSKRSTQA